MDAPTYATTARLAAASDIALTPTAERGLLRYLDGASRDLETLCGGRRWYPTRETRTLDWPDPGMGSRSDRIWLDTNELIGAPTALTVAGEAFTSYKLRPDSAPDRGRPYRWIEPDYNTTRIFSPFTSGNAGPQDAITITGPFGASEQLTAATTLAAAVGSTSTTEVTVADGSVVGPGDALRVGSEYVLVTAAGWVDTGETLAGDLAVDSSDGAITVADSTLYTEGELLRVDRERMEIEEIGDATTIYVRRESVHSRLAAHTTGATIWARRGLTVERGKLGTTAATHADAATVSRLTYPPYIELGCVGLAMANLAQERAAWARTVGSGENERETSGRNLQKLLDTVRRKHGMRGQVRAAGGPAAW